MILEKIIEVAALKFGDPDQTHMTEAQWIVFANAAERELARVTLSISTRVSGLTFTDDTYLYDIATFFGSYDVLSITGIEIDGKTLRRTSEYKLENANRSFRDADAETPVWLYTTKDNKLGISPPPDADNISNVVADIDHLPTTDMTAVSDTPELNPLFHDDLADFMVYYACIVDKDMERIGHIAALLRNSIKRNKRQFRDDRHFVNRTSIPDFISFSDV